MSLFNIFNIAGSGMSAQLTRMSTTASNLSNADVVGSSESSTYRARYPIFKTVHEKALSNTFQPSSAVEVSEIVESDQPLQKIYQPYHQLADKDGYIYKPNVNMVEEMTDMISATRSYQLNVKMLEAVKQMANETLELGK